MQCSVATLLQQQNELLGLQRAREPHLRTEVEHLQAAAVARNKRLQELSKQVIAGQQREQQLKAEADTLRDQLQRCRTESARTLRRMTQDGQRREAELNEGLSRQVRFRHTTP